jgi:hypothetical protein
MNLNHWVDAAWANSSWVSESWGDAGGEEEPASAPSTSTRSSGGRKRRLVLPEFEEEEELILAKIALPKKIKLKKHEIDLRTPKAEFADIANLQMSPYIEIKIPRFEKPKEGHTEDELWLLLH